MDTERTAALHMKQASATLTATKSTLEEPKEILVVDLEIKKDKISWSITASSGRTSFWCTARSNVDASGVVVCSLRVSGDFWERHRDLSLATTTKDFQVLLPQVLLDINSLEILRQKLQDWQSKPSAEFTCQLGTESPVRDQHFTFSIGRDEELINTQGRPACLLTYACGPSMAAKWSFIVDQSCIRDCAESLAKFLKSLA